jgi:hypothetical protein
MNQTTETATRRSDRIYVRMPVEIVVNSEGAKISHAASTVDLSTLGARVQTRVALVPGEQVSFIWHGATPQQLPSQVVWSAPGHSEQWREAGLQFLQPLQVAA